MRNVLCLVVDGLGAGALGCYGNTWLETPALDQLAAQSLILDQATTDCPDLMSVYRGWWQGLPAAADESRDRTTLAAVLNESGYETLLMTDEASLATHPLAGAFGQNIVLPTQAAACSAASMEETHAAQFFAAAVDALGGLDTPYFCWMHWRGMLGCWDAPAAYRERLADEEDPPPPESVDVPQLTLPPGDDPDHLLGIMQAYGGQVMLMDECFGGFWEQFQADPHADETLLMLCSPRGFPLGEHRVVGLAEDRDHKIAVPPYSELVHVPWLLRFGDGHGRLDRSSALVQPIDLAPTVLSALSIDDQRLTDVGVDLLAADLHQEPAVRDHASMATASHLGVRTRDWHYLEPRDAPAEDVATSDDIDIQGELYVKPDDRWEVNNVASLCREDAAELRRMLKQR